MTGPRAKAFQALGHVAIRTKLPRTLRLINMRSVSDILSYMHECLKGYITMSADRTVMDPRRYWCSCSGFQGLENRSVWRLSASVTNKGGISPYLQQSYMSLEHLFPAINTHGSIHNTGSLSSVVLEGKWNRPVVQKTQYRKDVAILRRIQWSRRWSYSVTVWKMCLRQDGAAPADTVWKTRLGWSFT